MTRRQISIWAIAIGLLTCTLLASDPALEKTIERAKDKRQQEIDRAGEAYNAAIKRADADLRRVFDSAIAIANKKQETDRAEALTALLETILSGTDKAESPIDDKQLEGAIKRRAAVVETSTKAFKLAVTRANTTLEKIYDTIVAGYKRKNDETRAAELSQEMAAIKAEDLSPAAASESSSASASSKTTNANPELIKAIGASLVDLEGKAHESAELASKDYVFIYFSASWCGPCRQFTPDFVKFHDDYAKKFNFEVIFVSSCNSKDLMAKYMKDDKMHFLAVPYENVAKTGLKQKYDHNGIPHLVLLDKEGNVVSSSVVNGQYVGPRKVLADAKSLMKIP
ncbi:MAG: thioredoxin-like domain-containing protein [Phycisphaeraceae bacterium]